MTEHQEDKKNYELPVNCGNTTRCKADLEQLHKGFDYMVRLFIFTIDFSKYKCHYKVNYNCFFNLIEDKQRTLIIIEQSPIKACVVSSIDTRGYDKSGSLEWSCTVVSGKSSCPPDVMLNHKSYLQNVSFHDGTYKICVDWTIDGKSVITNKPCIEVVAENCDNPPPGPKPPGPDVLVIHCLDNCDNVPDRRKGIVLQPFNNTGNAPVTRKVIWHVLYPNGTEIPVDDIIKHPQDKRKGTITIDPAKLPPDEQVEVYYTTTKEGKEEKSAPYDITVTVIPEPSNGNCTMTPLSGMKGVTLFDIECYGWQAEGPILYEFFDKGQDDIEHYQGRMIGYSYSGILSKFRLTRGRVVIYLINEDGYGPCVNISVQLTDFDRNKSHIEYLIDEMNDFMDYENYPPSLDIMSTIAEILYKDMDNEHYLDKIISTMNTIPIDSAENMKLGLSTILSILTNGTLKGTYLLNDVLERYTGNILLGLAKVYLKYATKPDFTPRFRSNYIHQLSRNMMDCVDMTIIAQNRNVTKLGPEVDINYDVLDNLNFASNDISEALMIAIYLVGRVQTYGEEGMNIVSTEKLTDVWAYVNSAEGLLNVTGKNQTSYINISQAVAKDFDENHDVMLQFAPMKGNLFWWAQDNINTEILMGGLAEKLYRPGYYFVPKFKDPVQIFMKIKKVDKTTINGKVKQLDPNLGSDDLDRLVLVHRFILPPLSKLFITFKFNNGSASSLRVLATFDDRPIWETMTTDAQVVSAENPAVEMPYDTVEREHFYYLGILPDKSVAINDTVDYTFDVHLVNCHIWLNQWVNHFCLVGPQTSEETVECQCTHMSIFSGSIFVPPNDINPILDAPLFLTIPENPYVVIFVLIIILLFILLLLWAFRKDRKDALCSDVVVLHDNFPGESYAYLIAIFTGSRLTAGTTATVGLRLYGDTYASRPAILKCSTRKVLQRDHDDWFLLTYPVSLGILNAVQMWHNNAGKSPDWYCSKIIVYDLHAKTQYLFVVEQWLAMEVDEFPEALVRPATSDEVMSIKRVFLDNSILGLRENHLHLSVLTRHPRSPVSRKERLICLMVLVMTAMLSSIMFFKITDKFDENVDDYRYSFGQREMMISIQAFVVSAVVSFIAMFLFRKSYKQKEVYRHHSTLFMPRKRSSLSDKYWLSEKPAFVDLSTFIAYDEKPPKQRKDMSMYESFIVAVRRLTHQKALRPVHLATDASEIKVKKGWLIAAWTFSILIIIVCAYLVMLYSLKFGKIKSLKWLSSLVANQAQDIFLFTPLKILLVALVLSAALERTTDVSAFKLDVNKAVKIDLQGNKKYLDHLVESRKSSIYYPMTDEVKAKKRRKAVRKMKWKVILDFVAVLCCILLLSFLMGQLWSGSHFHPNTHAANIMMNKYHGRFVALRDIYNRTQFFSYLENTFVRSLFVFRWFNDLKFPTLSPPDTNERRDWTKDYVSKMVGAPRLRQLRVVLGICSVKSMMVVQMEECNPPWSQRNMDTETYSVEWMQAGRDDMESYEWGHRTYWMYTEPKNTSVFPISGKSGTVYPTGGYIFPLDVMRAETKSYAVTVDKEHWIDERTRAVFLELTLYNCNSNLYSQVTAVIEHMTSGFFLTAANVDSVNTQEDWDVFNVVYIVFIVVLMLRVAYKMNRNGFFNFLKRLLNIYEVLVIFIGILSVVCYLVHLKVSSFYAEQFRRHGLDNFFNFEDMIKYFLYTKVFLWVLFCLLVFRLFVSWYFGCTYVYFYKTFVLSQWWITKLMILSLVSFIIIWRFIGYTIDAKVFYNERVLILHYKMFTTIYERECQSRTKMVAFSLCYLMLFFKVIFFTMFTHYYQIGKRTKLEPMHYFNFITFVKSEIIRFTTKKKEEELPHDHLIHRRRDIKIPRSR